ncbi:hypothetical protein [Kitasatospora humi]|uniref:hypothetical protein n=1 Tax=Kitasatospora humi TaxID=2893891 RepID=UPI003558ECCB
MLVEVVSRPGVEVSLPTIVRELDAAGVAARDVALRTPTLDDVFLALTGTGGTTSGTSGSSSGEAPEGTTGSAATSDTATEVAA